MKQLLSSFLCITTLMLFTSISIIADDYVDESTPPVINVLIPSTLDFVIDPFELAGKGQVYSEEFSIINHGETDVLLTFTDLEVVFTNDIEFEQMAEPFIETGLYDNKSIYLSLNFGNGHIPPVVLTAPEMDLPIQIPLHSQERNASESALQISISGNVNPSPAKNWNNGDVKIKFIYKIEALPSLEDEEIESQNTGEEEALSVGEVYTQIYDTSVVYESRETTINEDKPDGEVILSEVDEALAEDNENGAVDCDTGTQAIGEEVKFYSEETGDTFVSESPIADDYNEKME